MTCLLEVRVAATVSRTLQKDWARCLMSDVCIAILKQNLSLSSLKENQPASGKDDP